MQQPSLPNCFDPLFRPFTVSGLTLANRIVMSPMGRNFSTGGVPSPAYRDYFRRRALGGVGLCIGEAAAVAHPVSSSDAQHANFHGDDALAAWAGIAGEVRAAGGTFFPQIWHAGLLRGLGPGAIPNAELSPIGPSGWAIPLVHRFGWVNPIETAQQLSEPMSQADIDHAIAAFGRAAADARRIGCSGIEIHGAHGYLIDEFFWDRMNFRDDRYGGDLESRTRFGAEVIAECRRQTGPKFPIFFRYSQWKQQDYHVKLAQTPQELERFLAPLTDAGVDLFDCSTRRFWEPEFAGSDLNLAGWTKKLTGKPTMTVGSVALDRSNWIDEEGFSLSDAGLASLDPLLERLHRGEFDLVGIGRALIANPELPNLLRGGAYERLRPYSNESLGVLE
jgi:2,4-dienoyl-CoA reductase-like NADH-dependent reductase (Old Yellow Enzyme family)